jgi:hypothetical protein
MCITKKGTKQTSETTALLVRANPSSYLSMLDWRSHSLDIYTNQPSSLSLNHYRNYARIIYNSGEAAIKYPLITSLVWLYWHCENGLEQCEHNTNIESFILTQCIIGLTVFMYNVVFSRIRLQHEEKSIAITIQISRTKIALCKKLIERNSSSHNENFSNSQNHNSHSKHIQKLTQFAQAFSQLHPKQANTLFTKLFSCHTWPSTAYKSSLFLVTFLDTTATFYMLKIISAIAYNHISKSSSEVESVGLFPTFLILVASLTFAILRSRNDIISRSHASNIHQVSHDIANCIAYCESAKVECQTLKSIINKRPLLFNDKLRNPEFEQSIKYHSGYNLTTIDDDQCIIP